MAAPASARLAGSLANPAFRRDPRIDIVRGIALLFVYIDHIIGNQFAGYTLQRFAFFDCADVFVFLSGYVSGLVYTRALLNDGFHACCKKALRRCAQILFAHIAVSWCVFLVLYLFLLRGVRFPFGAYTFVERPWWALINVVLLRHLPGYISILPMYVCLFASAPLMALGSTRYRRVWFFVPVALYLVANRVPEFNLYSEPGHVAWFFRPAAWQLVFALGFLVADLRKDVLSRVRVTPQILFVIISVLAAITIVRVAPTSSVLARIPHTKVLLQSLPQVMPFTRKPNAEPLRIFNFVFAVTLVSSIGRSSRLWSIPGLRHVLAVGQNSLFVYSLGAVLAPLATCLRVQNPHNWRIDLALTIGGCSILLGAGRLAQGLKARASTSAGEPPLTRYSASNRRGSSGFQ